MKLTPKNRNLLIRVEEEVQEESAILLPEDYKKSSPYKVVEILDVAKNCSSFSSGDIGKLTIVPTHTIISIEIEGKNYSLVLENLALGVVDEE